MKRSHLLPLAALLAAGCIPASAQDATPKISGLLQVWYTQMLDNNLRLNGAATTNGNKYYDAKNVGENTFLVRRSEIHVSGPVPGLESFSYEVNIDPSISTSASNPTILQDATLTYKSGPLSVVAGQFKNQRTYEGVLSSSMLIFAERAQLSRKFGDARDRGVTFGYGFGDKAFGGKLTLGVFNGMVDAVAGKANDTNAQKDFIARVEFNVGSTQKFGVWSLQGSTDQADKGGLTALTFAGTTMPTAAQITNQKDETKQFGAFYVYDDGTWHFDAEALSATLGRLFPSVGAASGSAKREGLDQKALGYYVTGAYTVGQHTFALRYDFMNWNQGDDWYTTYNPYKESAPGVARLVNGASVDYTPKFTEITAGYTYAFSPKSVKAANLKLNYVHRSKNFLAPRTGQTGEQGGDNVILAYQLAF
ncbi:hypothetical protein GETHLI_11350 [Geothrix limicola]|uniref:Porin n=1 Tax=Geothrix limicola TaxID=2927978 RepID=A0ABQ5QDI8_9BACT|nr:hypothetical protein [Geothrix limicola]GLH72633.1 hypothetical protein GETHLI_11350 [Geothrix limicola]